MKTPSIKDIRTAAEARRRKRRRGRRIGVGVLIVVVVAVVFGFVGLPPIVRGQLETRLSEAIGREVVVGQVRLNPLALSLAVEAFEILERDGSRWLGWERLYVNFEAWSLVSGEWRFSAIDLVGFDGRGHLGADGKWNFADVLATVEARGEAAGEKRDERMRPVVVGRLIVEGARVDLTDESRAVPYHTEVGPISFVLEDFRTAGDGDAQSVLVARTAAGEELRWAGALSVEARRSVGEIEVIGFSLPRHATYLAEFFRGEVRGGLVDFSGKYEVDLSGAEPVARLVEGRVAVRDLALGEPGVEESAVRAAAITLDGIAGDLAARRASVAQVSWVGGRVAARQTAPGLDLLAWLPATAAEGEPGVPWALSVGAVGLEGIELDLRDETTVRPSVVQVRELVLKTGAVASAALDTPVAVELSARVNGGTVQVAGAMTPATLGGELEVAVEGIEIAPVGPMLERWVAARVTGGVVEARGRVGGAWPALTWAGDLGVRKFAVVDAAQEERLAAWDELVLAGVQAELEPLVVNIDTVAWRAPEARVVVAADGSVNLARLAVAGGNVEVGEDEESVAPLITIAQVVLNEARVSFLDESIQPAVTLSLDGFTGTVAGLSSLEPTKGEVNLTGRVNGVAPVVVSGRLNPLGETPSVEVRVEFDRFDLRPAGPYVAKYAGYQLARGRATLDLRAALDGSILDTDTVLTLDDFTLGARTNSPAATKLPVTLAVALLKDRSGQIVIDLPVKGNLDDPEFRIGRVVGRVVVNLLTRVATSPFALLGALVPGGAEVDLSHVEFAAGASTVDEASREKLDTLIAALQERPALQLAVTGAHEAATDKPALQRAAVEAEVRAALAAKGMAAADGTARAQVVGEMFATRFPDVVREMAAQAAATGVRIDGPRETRAPVPVAREPEVGADESFLAWLRSVFGGRRAAGAGEGAGEVEPGVAEVAQPRVPLPGEIEALPVAEMEARLVAAVGVPERDLQALATARATAVREYLVTAMPGLAERVTLAGVVPDAARVNLELR